MRTARTPAPSEKTRCFRLIANMRGEFLFGETSDIDGHDDFLFDRGVAKIQPEKRIGVSSVSRRRDANAFSIRGNAVGGVEFNPAGVGRMSSTPASPLPRWRCPELRLGAWRPPETKPAAETASRAWLPFVSVAKSRPRTAPRRAQACLPSPAVARRPSTRDLGGMTNARKSVIKLGGCRFSASAER